MRFIAYFLILFSLLGCSSLSMPGALRAISSEQNINVVFDIDWTIVSNFDPELTNVPPQKMYHAEGKTYVLRDGVTSLIEYLLSKNIQVSFFSGGTKIRNQELLGQILLHDGRSLLDIAYKIKSDEDLTKIPNALETAKFSEKFKKDLTKISKDLDNIILLDDTPNFYLNEEQKMNLIWFGPTYEYFEEYKDSLSYKGKYKPQSFEQWSVDRNKMLLIKNHIERALFEMKEKKISFLRAMKLIEVKMNYPTGALNPYTVNFIKKIKPLKNDLESNQCTSLILPFLLNN